MKNPDESNANKNVWRRGADRSIKIRTITMVNMDIITSTHFICLSTREI